MVAAVPTAAFIVANDYHSLEDQGCAIVDTQPYTGRDARLVQVRIVNKAESAKVRVCVNEDGGTERHEERLELAAKSEYTMLVKVSPTTRRVGLDIDRPGYEYTEPVYVSTGAGWTLPTCTSGIPDLVAETEFYGNGSSLWSKKPTCT